MRSSDGRKLSPQAQEERRRLVVRALDGGMSWAEATTTFGVSLGSISNWMKVRARRGMRGLKRQRRGRPPQAVLKGYQAAQIVRQITVRCPDQLKFPFMLWTREAVQLLIRKKTGLQLSVWTVGRYLKKWGFSPQKPVRRAYEQNPLEVLAWLRREYPEIEQLAKALRALIFWCDELGLRSDCQAGRSYAPVGQTPVIPGTGKRFGCNMISALNNRGKLAFMVFTQRFNAEVFIEFLRRLLRMNKGRRVFLIVDRHPVHYRSRRVKQWVAAQGDRLKLFYLPPYAPERNPDEMLNNDVKNNALARRRPKDQPELLADVRSYLRSTQKRPEIVRNYFQERHVKYAAGA
jgi:transposase